MRTGRGLFAPMLLLLLFTGVAHAQLPFRPKFLAAGPDDSPFIEARRDALNLHDDDDASVALVAPIAINCTALGTDFKSVLLQKGAHPAPSLRGSIRMIFQRHGERHLLARARRRSDALAPGVGNSPPLFAQLPFLLTPVSNRVSRLTPFRFLSERAIVENGGASCQLLTRTPHCGLVRCSSAAV
jgi:hypothetical protein